MANGYIHTSKQGDPWINKAEGNERATNSAATKSEAQAAGREMAIERGVEHGVHNQDGRIGERNTYPRSRDPRVEGLTGYDLSGTLVRAVHPCSLSWRRWFSSSSRSSSSKRARGLSVHRVPILVGWWPRAGSRSQP